MTLIAALALCVAVSAMYWAWQVSKPSREILRIRADREAAKTARRPHPKTTDLRTIEPVRAIPPPKDPFRDPPRSIRAFDGWSARYVRQPTSSLDWMGAPWASPTALDFEQSTIDATEYVSRVVYVHERPVPPQQIICDLESMWHRMREEVRRAGVVVDAREVIGVTVGGDFRSLQGDLSVRLKCWPAIEGVTTPRKDRTL